MSKLTIVGGGLSGPVAAITAAERGTEVELFEARKSLGGRARTKSGDFRANIGAHAFWKDGQSWKWLRERNLLAPAKRSPLTGSRFYYRDRIRQAPPRSFLKFLRLHGKEPPVDESFRAWVIREVDAPTAEALSNAAGVFTYYHDPGALSAAFVPERGARLLSPPPPNTYFVGGWQALGDKLEQRARDLGVVIETGSRIGELPAGLVIVVTTHDEASKLLPGGRPHCHSDPLRLSRLGPQAAASRPVRGVGLAVRRMARYVLQGRQDAGPEGPSPHPGPHAHQA